MDRKGAAVRATAPFRRASRLTKVSEALKDFISHGRNAKREEKGRGYLSHSDRRVTVPTWKGHNTGQARVVL